MLMVVVILQIYFLPWILASSKCKCFISNMVCNSLSDLTIEVSQDSGEVDMSTGLIVSKSGSFDIASMNLVILLEQHI